MVNAFQTLYITCPPWWCFTFKLSALWSNWRCFQQSNWNLTMHRTLAIASSYSCREHSMPGRYEFNHFTHYGSTYTISAGVGQCFLIPFTFAVPCPNLHSSLYVHKLYCAIIILCAVINFVSLKIFFCYCVFLYTTFYLSLWALYRRVMSYHFYGVWVLNQNDIVWMGGFLIMWLHNGP